MNAHHLTRTQLDTLVRDIVSCLKRFRRVCFKRRFVDLALKGQKRTEWVSRAKRSTLHPTVSMLPTIKRGCGRCGVTRFWLCLVDMCSRFVPWLGRQQVPW